MKIELALLLSGAVAAAQELPPNHPAIDKTTEGAPAAGSLPPGHPAQGDVDPKALLQQLDSKRDEVTKKPKNFDIAFALGNLYYENARYAEAAEFFAQAISKAQPAFRLVDQTKTKVKGAPPSASQAGCDQMSVEQRIERAQELEKGGNESNALACALAAQAPALEAHTRRATAVWLAGHLSDAMKEYDEVLSRDVDSVEANYRLGALLFDAFGEDVPKLKRAKQVWDRFLALAPEDHRAPAVRGRMKQLDEGITKGGVSRAAPLPNELLEAPPMAMPAASSPPMAEAAPGGAPGSIPSITPEMAEAVANTPRGPEFEAGLARSLDDGEKHLAKAEYQEAVQSFRSVLPYEPNNARARAGMAAAMIGLGRPMADRIFSAAMELDPSSIDSLAQKLETAGNPSLAGTLRQKRKASGP